MFTTISTYLFNLRTTELVEHFLRNIERNIARKFTFFKMFKHPSISSTNIENSNFFQWSREMSQESITIDTIKMIPVLFIEWTGFIKAYFACKLRNWIFTIRHEKKRKEIKKRLLYLSILWLNFLIFLHNQIECSSVISCIVSLSAFSIKQLLYYFLNIRLWDIIMQ